MKNILTVIKFFLGWPLSVAALFFIVKIISLNSIQIIDNISGINLWLLTISIICFLMYYFLRSYFWSELLAKSGFSIPLKEVTYFWGLSEIKRFIPGNIWGFLGRTASFSEKNVKKSVIITSIFFESTFITIASLLLSLFALPRLFSAFSVKISLNTLFIPLLIFGVLILVAVFSSLFLIKKFNLVSRFKKRLPPLTRYTNAYLLFLMLVCFIFFGLGMYFSISSVYFLNPKLLLSFVGLFVFSYFVGYISVITPMGLGVREGIITALLSPFVNFNLAGFLAIFARIILILTELIFVSLAYFWFKLEHGTLIKAEIYIKRFFYEILLVISVVIYNAYFITASCYRYINYYTGRFDLGNMDQTIWNTLHGHFFQLTNPDGTNIISRLAFHSDFILILLTPLYLIWSDPRILLIFQSIVLSLGAVFVFLIAKKIIRSKSLSFLIACAYLLNPAMEYSNLYDFHAVTLATTFILASYYFYLRRLHLFTILFLFLAAITKEEVWFVVALFGFFMAIKPVEEDFKKIKIKSYFKERLIGLIIFLVSSIVFYFLFFKIIPSLHGGNHFALTYYSDFGTTPTQVLSNLFFYPQKTLATIFAFDRLKYLKDLLSPFGFLPLFSPIFLIFTLPDISINLLSSNSGFHQIFYQYTAIITPFLCIASINAIEFLSKKYSKLTKRRLTVYLFVSTIISAFFYGPLPGSLTSNLDMFVKPQPYREVIDNFLTDIPHRYSIAASNNLGSHLSHRQKIFTIPTGIDQADVILFLLNDKFATPTLSAQKQMAENMKHDQKYVEIFKLEDFIVFEKRSLFLQTEPNLAKVKLFPFSIQTLEERDFSGGNINILNKISDNKVFTSYLISYPSDGLTVTALMDVPDLNKPQSGFPVIIVNHGFILPSQYNTEKSYAVIADYFASNGFLVIKPDYRGNGKSDKDISHLISYPIDVLNLISSIPTLNEANPSKIFLWGHSTGSEIVLTTLAANNQNSNFTVKIRGAVVWSPATDPYRTYTQFKNLFFSKRVPYSSIASILGSIDKNPLIWQSVSPLYYLSDITTPVQIMHGSNDRVIPYQWSIELYNDFISLGTKASLKIYPGDDHTLSIYRSDALAKNLQFFKSRL